MTIDEAALAAAREVRDCDYGTSETVAYTAIIARHMTDVLAEAEGRAEKAERERDEWQKRVIEVDGWWDEMETKLSAAEQRVEAMREAITKTPKGSSLLSVIDGLRLLWHSTPEKLAQRGDKVIEWANVHAPIVEAALSAPAPDEKPRKVEVQHPDDANRTLTGYVWDHASPNTEADPHTEVQQVIDEHGRTNTKEAGDG